MDNRLSTIKIKICGLKRPEDILAVNEAEPDFAGFVFAKSRRQVTHDQAKALKKLLSPSILAVGVFVNAPLEEILQISQSGAIDCIQLHGDETAHMVRAVKAASGLPVIKAVRVANREDFGYCASFPSDYLLLDTFSKDGYGGSGKQFDWSLIPRDIPPFFLAGGLTADPPVLKNAIGTGACCLDVSSAVETNGEKDAKKIKDFIQAVRQTALECGD